MPRPPRHSYLIDNGFYHVISRSINDMTVFKDADDFVHFLELERRAKQAFPIRLFHYVLMSTHFHVVLQAVKTEDLPQHVAFLKRNYTRWYQKKYSWRGPLWRERYRSLPIENEEYLAACGLYVELNPVKAGICQRPEEYPYSSAKKYDLGHPMILSMNMLANQQQTDSVLWQSSHRRSASSCSRTPMVSAQPLS